MAKKKRRKIDEYKLRTKLIFEDNSHFHMLIFDESATEIDYPSNRPYSNEQGKVDEECESESSVQILSNSPQHPKTRDTSLISQCQGQSHKKKMKRLNGKDEALKKASGFKSKNPYFMVVMQPSFVKAWYMTKLRNGVRNGRT
ncbi:hypothetical protein CFP56_023411 [Quercus suber]|uniref:Uncharacterized protein n=1 Tax=Quercus suber TaxID=58331 RepID=A0AAW0KCP1_QUESU